MAARSKPFERLSLLWSQSNTLAVDKAVPGLSDSIVGRSIGNGGAYAPCIHAPSLRKEERLPAVAPSANAYRPVADDLEELGLAIARARQEQAGAQKSSREVLSLIERARAKQRGEQLLAVRNIRRASQTPVLLGERYFQKFDKPWRNGKYMASVAAVGRSKSTPRPATTRRPPTPRNCWDDSLVRYGPTIDNDFAMGTRLPRSCRPNPKESSSFRQLRSSRPSSARGWSMTVEDMYLV
uniref:Uncharacterized protein n=1 Tax=Palpitomonas bilix TaxID=652834 RepID=A0A7S3D614_9EUKA|mmetsp:Transcript_22828/g.58105  ORF Transcript_22828/g.58105 Transcript_22828/m.58105 type:complete len:239 (+) Transcript_22828:184-900(+)|eukprot:CAMPEP_0113889756 /NCGR_PEP_ID=MMETSP0780_2-20120614/13712_1 /TAXON_ID=652834 /ORGANISM="Palpitomonas bilix" /LENGTH=238 /DNA_ID=CAMNT_0000878967 /DNA_START=158 /DNA_END=874 /DNA_ORIENTATION=- /assembly_acc=CAM_ASM_000599